METDSTPDDSATDEAPMGTHAGADEVYCWHCGETIAERAEICPHCGVRQRRGRTLDEIAAGGNPFVAALASFIFPGLGQLYNRELEKGVAIAALFLVSLASVFVLVGFVAAPIVWLYAIYDAYRVADERGASVDGRV